MAGHALDVLVCVKRVPESSSEITLTADGQAVDGRYVGFTTSDHEQCAVEAAVQLVAELDGEPGGAVTVLTLGPAEAVEQLRGALAVGATAATHVVADSSAYGPADVAREIAEVVRAHEAEGRPHDLVLLGNDAADSGDFQVGIRLAHVLGRPVVNGAAVVELDGDTVVARGNGPDGQETYRVPLPAVVTVLEGGVSPRYPSMTGRVKARKVAIEERTPAHEPAGPSRVRLTLPPPAPSQVQVLGEGAAAAPAMVDLLHELGVGR